jgi:hypothetical protein
MQACVIAIIVNSKVDSHRLSPLFDGAQVTDTVTDRDSALRRQAIWEILRDAAGGPTVPTIAE